MYCLYMNNMMTAPNGNIFRVTDPFAGNSPVTGEFPAQRPVTRSFDVFFDLCLNKSFSKQSWDWWFEMPSHSLWRHGNENGVGYNGHNPWRKTFQRRQTYNEYTFNLVSLLSGKYLCRPCSKQMLFVTVLASCDCLIFGDPVYESWVLSV